MSKYEKAIRAANKKDATELSWELIKVVLMDLNSGVDGELNRGILTQLLSNVAPRKRGEDPPAEGAEEELKKMKDWMKGKIQ